MGAQKRCPHCGKLMYLGEDAGYWECRRPWSIEYYQDIGMQMEDYDDFRYHLELAQREVKKVSRFGRCGSSVCVHAGKRYTIPRYMDWIDFDSSTCDICETELEIIDGQIEHPDDGYYGPDEEWVSFEEEV